MKVFKIVSVTVSLSGLTLLGFPASGTASEIPLKEIELQLEQEEYFGELGDTPEEALSYEYAEELNADTRPLDRAPAIDGPPVYEPLPDEISRRDVTYEFELTPSEYEYRYE